MHKLTKNTLKEISLLTNDVIRLSKYLQESKLPFYVNHINNVASEALVNKYILTFDKDINETVNLIYNLATVWATADKDGVAHEIDSNEKNLKKLFNIESNFINIFGIYINLRTAEKDNIKSDLLSNILNISENEYKNILKKAKADHTDNSYLSSDANEDEKFLYLIRKTAEDTSKSLANHISKVVGQYIDFRNDLSIEEKSIIDDDITFTRTMVDGVLKSSTYITEEGIQHISDKHKKDITYQNKVNKIFEIIKTGKIFYGTEIDQDTSLDKIINVLEQAKSLNLNTNQKFIFKARKLGNYNVAGMFFNGFKIVSVDVNYPSALIHELSHAVDFNNDHVMPESRIGFINLMRNRLKEQYLDFIDEKGNKHYLFPKDYSYLSSSVEIIARAGELGYILQKYDYQGHSNNQELSEFFNKVRQKQKEENIINADEKNILLCNPIDYYIMDRSYFGFNSSMSADYFMMIKDFYKGYYNANNQNIFKPLPFDRIKELEEILEYKRSRDKKSLNKFNREENPISFLNLDNIDKLVQYNEIEQIFSNKDLVAYIFKNFSNFNRTRKVENDEHCADRINDFIKISTMTDKFTAGFNKYLKDLYYYSAFPSDNIRSSISISEPVLGALELKEDFNFINTAPKTLGHVNGTGTRVYKSEYNRFASALAYLEITNNPNIRYDWECSFSTFKYKNEKNVNEEISLGKLNIDSILEKNALYNKYMTKVKSLLEDMNNDEIHKTIFLYGQIFTSLSEYKDYFKTDYLLSDLKSLKEKQEVSFTPKKEEFWTNIETTLKCFTIDFYPEKINDYQVNQDDDVRLRKSEKFRENYKLKHFRDNQIHDIEYRSKYNKRLQLEIETSDFKDASICKIFDKIFNKIETDPDNVFKNKTANNYGPLVPVKLMKKVLSKDCTVEDKLTYMNKLNFASLNTELIKDIINEFCVLDNFTQEKAIQVVTYDKYLESSYFRRNIEEQLQKTVPLAILNKNKDAFFNGTYEVNIDEIKETVNEMLLESNVNSLSSTVSSIVKKSHNSVEEDNIEKDIKFEIISKIVFEEIIKPANKIMAQKGLGEITFKTIIDWATNIETDAFAMEKKRKESELFLYPILLSAKGSGKNISIENISVEDKELMKTLYLIEEDTKNKNKNRLNLK